MSREAELAERPTGVIPSEIVFGKVREFLKRVGQIPGWVNDHQLAAALGLILTVSAAACGGGEKGPAITPTTPWEPIIGPTIEATITPTVAPTATREPTPEPTLPPTLEPTKPPTPKPTVQPTPTPTELPPKPQGNWVIEVDPEIREKISPQKIEEDLKRIQVVIDKFPQIGNLEIILKPPSGWRHVDYFDPSTQQIIIIRDYEHFPRAAPDDFEIGVAHEVSHYLDPELNYEALLAFLTEQQLDQLKKLREQALSDSFWGRDYPDLEKIFAQIKNQAPYDLYFGKKYTQEQLANQTDFYPNAIWISTNIFHDSSEEFRPFRGSLSAEFKTIEEYASARESQVRIRFVEVVPMDPFFEDQKEKIAALAAKNPVFAKAIELIKAKRLLFTHRNIIRYALTPVRADLEGSTVAKMWRALPRYINIVLAEAILEGNTEVIDLFDPAELETIKSELYVVQEVADAEKFANLGVVTILFGEDTPLSPLFKNLALVSQSR